MFEDAYVKTKGSISLYARKYGCGHPILMIHGACVDSDFFHEAAEALSSMFQVITYDRRGYGRSTAPHDGDCSIRSQAEDAAAVVEAFLGKDGQQCFVVGSSAGCTVALELAARRPELARSMLLHEPALMDCLLEGNEVLERIKAAKTAIENGLYSYPLHQLLSLESMDDERARQATEQECAHRDANRKQFLHGEAWELYRTVPDYPNLQHANIVVGIGERSLGTYHAQNCPALAEKVNGRLVYFPGGHNCAFDLPFEFACMVIGVFASIDRTYKE